MSSKEIGYALGQAWARSNTATKVVAFAIFAGLVAWGCSGPNATEKSPQAVPALPLPPDPAAIAAAAEKAQSEQRLNITIAFARLVKNALRDPDSLVWENVRANADASVICIEYRARNGFGGMNREFALIAERKFSQTPEDWNLYCTKPLATLTRQVKAYTS